MTFPPHRELDTYSHVHDPTIPDIPRLDFSLRVRKLRIFIFWFLIFVDSVLLPVLLYFLLWYGTDLDHDTVFNIITALLGGTAILEYFQRFWRLCKKNSTCRVLGTNRFSCDWFQWRLTIAFGMVIAELIVGTLPKEPMVRLLALPLPTFVAFFGLELILLELLYMFRLSAPFRISSIARGQTMRPAVYPVIEDIVAVDGGAGTAFRMRLDQRYEASPYFRHVLHRISLFWAVPAILVAGGTACVVFLLDIDRDLAYVLGWVIPFSWACIWAIITTKLVQRELRIEQRLWDQSTILRQV